MHVYRVLFTGYGANNAIYREQVVELKIRHDWSRNNDEATSVMFLVHKNLKSHFSKYDILHIEKLK